MSYVNQCPTMDQWCEYDRHEWRWVGKRDTTGTSTAGVKWPERFVSSEIYREGMAAHYEVAFVDAELSAYRHEVSFDDFERFRVAQTWLCERTRAGGFTVLRLEGK